MALRKPQVASLLAYCAVLTACTLFMRPEATPSVVPIPSLTLSPPSPVLPTASPLFRPPEATPSVVPVPSLTLLPPSPVPPTASPLSQPEAPRQRRYPGLIAYSYPADTALEICTISADGTDRTQLTHLAGFSFFPRWSPDGESIAFSHYDPRTGLIDIWIVDADGTDAYPVTEGGAAEQIDQPWLSWSPDSRFLLYTSPQPDDRERDVYRLEIATGQVKNLTADCHVWDSAPTWSPDGEAIAFVSDRTDGACEGKVTDEVWVMVPDGSGLTNLTNNHQYLWEDQDPAWSPSSREIAFYRWSAVGREYPGGRDGLWVVSIKDGSERLLYEFMPWDSDPPVWSPDGKYVAFNCCQLEETDVWIVPAAGGEATQLTSLPGAERLLSWSPDSRAIVFTEFDGDNRSVYVVAIDGTDIWRPIESGTSAYGNWSP